MSLIAAVLAGHVAGAPAASWRTYEDSPHEGFAPVKCFRSVVLAGAIALVL